ncbi:sigma-70 family RNA polymerase sigma factor [Clostridium sp. D33t1_170424_F3]|uniref:RNA polymerase sigma factor n=1 Tax=Clostridium sp. D33t1_170424_F3 TaxID=2787099 RepID=UPI0018A9D89B|nr:sigma-70 family RNA polymerase sigma factor [Clostridium sp. D33t1_170424_F3]
MVIIVINNTKITLDASSKIGDIFYEKAGMMYSIAFGIVKDPHDAEDVVMDAITKMLRYSKALIKLDDNSLPRYIAIITRNTAKAKLKKNSRNPCVDGVEYSDAILSDSLYHDNTTEDLFFSKLENTELLHALSPDYRDVLILKQHYGFNYRQISKLLSITEATARQRFSRVVKLIKDTYGSKGGNR